MESSCKACTVASLARRASQWEKSLDLLDAEQQFVYARAHEEVSAIVVINNDTKPSTLEFDVSMLMDLKSSSASDIVLEDSLGDTSGSTENLNIDNGKAKLRIPARSAAIYLIPRSR